MNYSAEQFVTEYSPHFLAEEVPKEAHHALTEVAKRYEEPWRHYHTVEHLQNMGKFLLEFISKLHSPSTVLLATVGHDSVYIPQLGGGNNERLSSQLLTRIGTGIFSRQELDLAKDYIHATIEHKTDNVDSDLSFFLDADMSIVGSSPERFRLYDQQIRQEFIHVPWEDYRQGRAHVLKTFNMREIFITPEAKDQYEDQAHKNIQHALQVLASKFEPEI